jgi:UDP-N-acetylglucosamine 2-epimerase
MAYNGEALFNRKYTLRPREKMSFAHSPYGDGEAAERIVKILERQLTSS